jgi:endoglucanase
MKAFRWCVLAALMLAATSLRAACTWPAWEQFKKDYISESGRVIDPSDTRKIRPLKGKATPVLCPGGE